MSGQRQAEPDFAWQPCVHGGGERISFHMRLGGVNFHLGALISGTPEERETKARIVADALKEGCVIAGEQWKGSQVLHFPLAP